MTTPALSAALTERAVSRLTHFTSSRNLPRIIQAGGILPTAELVRRGVAHVVTDPERFDGQLEHICCNVEFPNMYYFHKANTRDEYVNYSDWVVFLLAPEVAARPEVLFSPVNAALGSGRYLASGLEAYLAQYADSVNGRLRARQHNRASPTDVQAEVLVPGVIPLSEVRGIVVQNEETLRREHARLDQLGIDDGALTWYVAADMFKKNAVTDAVRGARTIELLGPYRREDGLVE